MTTVDNIEVKEFDWIYLPALAGQAREKTNTIRVIIVINGREFKRLFQHGYSPVWSEEGKSGFCKEKEREDLESIFKAWCMKNGKDIDNPTTHLLNQ